jgi:hypothetical protein
MTTSHLGRCAPLLIACVGATLATAAVSGCESKPQGTAGAASSAPSGSTPPSLSPSGSKVPPAPGLAGSQVKVKLSSGVSLTLPANATKRQSGAARALESVGRAQLFQLDGPGRLLSVTELAPSGQSCPARLDTEWQRMQKAKAETDPERLDLRRVGVAAELKIRGARVLYTEALQRGAGVTDGGRPFAAMASVMFCGGDALVVVMFASDQPSLLAGTKALLAGIAGSARPASGAAK